MGEIILGVSAHQKYLLDWLEVHTADVGKRTFPVDGGTLTLEPLPELPYYPNIGSVSVAMHGRVRSDGKVRARRVSSVMTLRVTPLGLGFTEVRIDPVWREVADYAVSLVSAIASRWPVELLNPPDPEEPDTKSGPPSVVTEARGDVSQQVLPASTGPGARVPRRPKDLVRWHATWQKAKEQWQQGKDYSEISAWLLRVHPNLRCSPETLADIVRAGHAGLLDG
jgi:hypothetical protein